jgi:AcrR family transcriptional regulator
MTDTSELSRADATRARLLDAAIAAFAEKGSHGTTTRDVATAAGMSPAALYVHHRSKEELLYLISRSGHEDTLRLVQQPITFSDDPATARYAQDLVVEWLVDPGDLEAVPELRTYAEADNGYAEELLVRLLFHQGDKQAATELRARAEAGNSDAAILLVRLFVERGDHQSVTELQTLADAGDRNAGTRLVELLAGQTAPGVDS